MIVLASFPKSGNTWVRFLIANIYNDIYKTFDEIDFHNIHDIIPELENPNKYFQDFPHIFKTHSRYKPEFENVILIVRNSWDVMLSYYHYLNGEEKKFISLEEVIRDTCYGINRLVEHTNSYTRNCKNLLVITYERLTNKPIAETKKICEFIELDVSEEIMKSAISKSSFNTMRRIEDVKGRKFGNKDFNFMRKGQVGEGAAKIKENQEVDKIIVSELTKSTILDNLYL